MTAKMRAIAIARVREPIEQIGTDAELDHSPAVLLIATGMFPAVTDRIFGNCVLQRIRDSFQ